MHELQTVTFSHEGVELQGQMAVPSGPGPHPAVLVVHTALGIGEHMRKQARLLASMGYVAVAVDMYGGGVYHSNPSAAGAAIAVVFENPALIRARIVAWHAFVSGLANVDSARIAAIGYCFGGRCVLELARSGADVKAVVSFHGLLETSRPAQRATIELTPSAPTTSLAL